jgi:hypothetical protein
VDTCLESISATAFMCRPALHDSMTATDVQYDGSAIQDRRMVHRMTACTLRHTPTRDNDEKVALWSTLADVYCDNI